MNYRDAYKNMLKKRGGSVIGNEILNSKRDVNLTFKEDAGYRLANITYTNLLSEEIDVRLVNIDRTTKEKYIMFRPDTKLNTGEIVCVDDERWLINEIEDNLILLNVPYGLEFDSKFDPHLKDLGNELDPVTLSDGEMTRVDIVVLCSLFKLLKRRYPSINIFTLDEVISTLDNSNSGAVLEFLKLFAKDNKLNCFVVSHTDLYLENFDEIIDVEKHNGFSRFNIMLTSV